MELINRRPSACLLCRHDLGPELARQLSASPHDPHVLVASVDDGCREVKVTGEGEEEDGSGSSESESVGEQGGGTKVEEIGQRLENVDSPVEKEDFVRRTGKAENVEQESLVQDDDEDGDGAKDNEKDSTLRQRKKGDKINTRGGQVETQQTSMREEQFSVELGEKNQSDFAGGEDALQKVAKFSFDGKVVVTGGVDGCVRVWKVREGRRGSVEWEGWEGECGQGGERVWNGRGGECGMGG